MSGLPKAAHDLLCLEDAKHSEWATACAIGMYAMNAGYTEDEFIQLVLESDFAQTFATEDKGRDRSNRLASRLSKVWDRVEAGWNPPLREVTNVRERLEALSQRLANHRWTGRTASKDRAVALALVQWAHEVGVWTLGAGTRELGLRAGVAHATAKKALDRLAALKLIKRDTQTKREGNRCQRWELNLDWGITDNIDPYEPFPPGARSYGLNMSVNHPVFLGLALGHTAERVWRDLAEHPEGSKAEAIAERTGLSLETVRRTLSKKLVPNGLAVAEAQTKGRGRPAKVYRLVPAASLDEVAGTFGVLDWHERTTERYERERGGYREVQRQQEQRKRERWERDWERGRLKREAEWTAFLDEWLPRLPPGVDPRTGLPWVDPRTIPDPFANAQASGKNTGDAVA
jgi:predicted transcriptional regulator